MKIKTLVAAIVYTTELYELTDTVAVAEELIRLCGDNPEAEAFGGRDRIAQMADPDKPERAW